MVLKKCIVGISLLLSTASLANAQIHGLSVTDTAEPLKKGALLFMGSTSSSENSTLYGARFGYGISDRILLFTDLGFFQTKFADDEFLAQVGFRYSLPVELPFNLAIRSTLIPYIASYEHYIEITFGLLASKYLDTESKWALYAGAGIDYQKWELELDYNQVTYIDIGDQTDPTFSFGLSRKLMGWSILYIEIAHVDDLFYGGGIKFIR